MPSVSLPGVSELPVGLPTRRLQEMTARFRPDVVHLASPFVLGAGGLAAARRLGVPTVAVYQTDLARFVRSLRRGADRAHGVAVAVPAAQAGRPHPGAVGGCRRRAARRRRRARAPLGSGRGRGAVRPGPARRRASAPARPGRRTARRLRRPAGPGEARGAARRAGRPGGCAGWSWSVTGRREPRLRTAPPRRGVPGHADRRRARRRATPRSTCSCTPARSRPSARPYRRRMASGVPVVAPDAGGPRELVHHGRTGYLVPARPRRRALRAAVVRLRDDAVLRHSFGRAARRAVRGRTWPVVCDELLLHYDAVMQPRVPNGRLRPCGSSSSPTSTAPAPEACAPPCTTSARDTSPAVTPSRSSSPARGARRHCCRATRRSPRGLMIGRAAAGLSDRSGDGRMVVVRSPRGRPAVSGAAARRS